MREKSSREIGFDVGVGKLKQLCSNRTRLGNQISGLKKALAIRCLKGGWKAASEAADRKTKI